ncbi:MAG: hypothetical protein NT069_23225, partial [Planctomycetota bacterium]|nr:hypothetical protein [Planctomycetota bacterium]
PELPEALHDRGGIASGDAPDPSARRAWRWLTFAVPPDLLLAGLTDGIRGPVRVDIVSPAVAALLRNGYCEPHLHVGVGFDFSLGWAATVNFVGRQPGSTQGMNWDAFRSPGAPDSEGIHLANWLLRSVIVRYLLAAYLHWGTSHAPSLREFLDVRLPDDLRQFEFRESELGLIRQAIHELKTGTARSDPDLGLTPQSQFSSWQRIYNKLTRVSLREYPQSLDAVQSLDPLCDFFSVEPKSGASVQLQFLWAGLRYLDKHPEDNLFAQLFWQVERIRCQVYRHCIQRPLTPGLTNFIRFYERKGAIFQPLQGVILESAGVLGGVGRGLRSLEIRTSPERDRDLQRAEIRRLRELSNALRHPPAASDDAADAPPRDPEPTDRRDSKPRRLVQRPSPWRDTECGLVLHFLRIRGKEADKGHPAAEDAGNFSDPGCSRNTRGYRWEQYFIDRRREASLIANALAIEPPLLDMLCGIDVCRDEHGVPTWVIAPLFDEVRKRVDEVRADYQRRGGVELPTLRTTAHVGEDFVHLATGIRYMDEALKFLPLSAGDRVGHGLALGFDAAEWSRRSNRLAMPREDRWFDLVWERAWHAAPDARFTTARRAYVEDEIVRLAHDIFGRSLDKPAWSALQAMEFVRGLYDFKRLTRLGFPDQGVRREPPTGIDFFLEQYLTNQRIYRNSRTVEWVESGRDGEATAELQRLVRRRYSDLGITIEVNPISNLLVGDLSDLQSHPLWRLAPGLGNDDGATLRMCIGSDDPFPFATSLPEEYQFLFDSLVLAGKSQAEAREWLDKVRQMGMESRFTREVV